MAMAAAHTAPARVKVYTLRLTPRAESSDEVPGRDGGDEQANECAHQSDLVFAQVHELFGAT